MDNSLQYLLPYGLKKRRKLCFFQQFFILPAAVNTSTAMRQSGVLRNLSTYRSLWSLHSCQLLHFDQDLRQTCHNDGKMILIAEGEQMTFFFFPGRKASCWWKRRKTRVQPTPEASGGELFRVRKDSKVDFSVPSSSSQAIGETTSEKDFARDNSSKQPSFQVSSEIPGIFEPGGYWRTTWCQRLRLGQTQNRPGKNFQMNRVLGRGGLEAAVMFVFIASSKPGRYLVFMPPDLGGGLFHFVLGFLSSGPCP